MPPATEMQQMEIDMVEGMYGDNFSVISADPPKYAVTFCASTEDPPELKIIVTYVDELYPDEGVPHIELVNISKERRIQTVKLQEELVDTASQNVGMHSVVLLLQRCQEFLTNLVEEEDKAALAKRGEALGAGVVTVVDPTIRMGNAVTREVFDEWRVKHVAEKRAVRAELAKKLARESASKLTGRQLWDSTLRNADWELFADGADADGAVGLDDAGFEYEFDEEMEEGGGEEDDA